ncbi:MAG: methylated-DNA--[protein]-cysteine S-methyltransferase [Ruminococcus sp.]
MEFIWKYNSPLGELTLESDGENLTGLWFENQQHHRNGLLENYTEKDLPIFKQTKQWLDIYFQGKEPGFTPPLKTNGTVFREKVWEILRTIPYGTTVTYGEIAKEIGTARNMKKLSAQAVGGAVGHNPIGIIIPCHRVIGASNNLTGYSGGLDKKVSLLEIEGIDTSSLHFPDKE